MSRTSTGIEPALATLARILEAPALDPPPGVTSRLTTYSDEQNWYYVAAVCCAVVPGVLLVLRMYTRLHIVRKVDVTDYVTMLGFLFFLGMIILGRYVFVAGAAVHQWNLKRVDLNNVLYWMNILEIFYGPTIFLVKFAILLQYLYLLAPSRSINPFLFICARVLIVLNLVYYIVSTCVSIWACSPREKIWNDLVPGKCLSNDTMIFITCVWNMLSDVAILIAPASSVLKLKVALRKKLGIILLFATGLLACITNAFIIMYLLRMAGENADVSYNIGWLGLWAVAEIALGLVVISLLTMPKFMEAKGKGWFSQLSKPFSSASTSLKKLTRSIVTRTNDDSLLYEDRSFSMGPGGMGKSFSERGIAEEGIWRPNRVDSDKSAVPTNTAYAFPAERV